MQSDWHEVLAEGLVLSGKTSINLVKIYSKGSSNRGSNADLEEKLSGFSGVKSTISQRFVVTGVTHRVPSPFLKKVSKPSGWHSLAPFQQYI